MTLGTSPNRFVSILAFTILLISAARFLHADAPSTDPINGEVAIRLIGPGGMPLANLQVVFETTDSHPFNTPAAPRIVTTTDASGVARFSWPQGVQQARVEAEHIGYGKTGVFEVVGGKTANVPLPPLAPFGILKGEVPADLARPNTTISLLPEYFGDAVSISLNENNQFVANVHAGKWWISAKAEGKQIARLDHIVTVSCGQTVGGLVLAPLTKQEQHDFNGGWAIAKRRPAQSETAWVTGKVSDDEGRPIAGATVYAAAIYDGGVRSYEEARAATTDEQGLYTIRGPAGQSAFSATIVAFAKGKPPALGWIALPSPPYSEIPAGATQPAEPFPTPPTPHRDFVLSSKGGRLDVAVLQYGTPARGATVALRLEGGSLRDSWARAVNDPIQKQVEQIAYPQAVAGDDGIAHFENLPPGRFALTAAAAGDRQASDFHERWPSIGQKQAYADAEGVVVRADQTQRLTISIYPHLLSSRLAIVKPDGSPLTGRPGLDYGRATGSDATGTSIELDGAGNGQQFFEAPGLWHLSVRYRDVPTTTIPLREPYYEAATFVAASSLLDGVAPIAVTAQWAEPGIVEVNLQDEHGKPINGIAAIGQPSDGFDTPGSTLDGHVDFCGLRRWHYQVNASLPNDPLPDLGGDGAGRGKAPLPDDATLTGHHFLPSQSVDVAPLTHQTVTFKHTPACYIRGQVHPPAGHKPGEFAVYPADTTAAARGNYFRISTGDFVAGPFPPGPLELRVATYGGGIALEKKTTVCRPDAVATVDFSPASPPVATADNGISISMAGAEHVPVDRQQFAGRVLMAGGKTPAYGATLTYFDRDALQPSIRAMTDARGNILTRGLWTSAEALPTPPAESPSAPTLVARLPGETGATIVDLDQIDPQSLAITLPKAVSVKGRIAIGGKATTDLHGQIRVLASYQGKGKLNPYLSIWATPQDDGTFELAGLTRGRYLVQATIDDIWLSAAVPLVVDGTNPSPIDLNVPALGGPVVLRLTDEDGSPLRNQKLKLDRPAGPLTDLFWPADFTTDGNGDAYIPALEAVPQIAHLRETRIEFTPPVLPCDKPTVVTRRVSQSDTH